MQRKFKCLIIFFILLVVALVLIFVLAGLDRLDFQKYGLNYNLITANFSDSTVFESGLHLVGISNVILEVPKTPIKLTLQNIQTFTNDYFPIQVNAQVTYSLVLPTSETAQIQFIFLRDFYINFGDESDKIIKPLIKNEITKIISSYSSNDFSSGTTTATTLQTQIKSTIQSELSIWTTLEVSIIITSIVVEGISQNTQALDRKIIGLRSKFQRVQFQKIQLTTYIQSILRHTQLSASYISNAVDNKIAAIATLLRSDNSQLNNDIGKVLFGNDVLSKNLSFASSQLSLRPELYMISNNTMI